MQERGTDGAVRPAAHHRAAQALGRRRAGDGAPARRYQLDATTSSAVVLLFSTVTDLPSKKPRKLCVWRGASLNVVTLRSPQAPAFPQFTSTSAHSSLLLVMEIVVATLVDVVTEIDFPGSAVPPALTGTASATRTK